MKRLAIVALLLLPSACATIRLDVPRTDSRALAHPEHTALGRAFAEQTALHPGRSGFHVLATGPATLAARTALADAAERTLDLQYYIVQSDLATALLLQRVAAAAQRGVRVRILLDDLHGPNRDFAAAAAAADPRIEVRLFNPFLQRGASGPSRLFDVIRDGERLNRRMHVKLWIADSVAGIFGGRNLGDEYFDAGPDANFVDLDLLAVGPLVPELARIFDEYWNSEFALPIAAIIDAKSEPGDVQRALVELDIRLAGSDGAEAGQGLVASEFIRQLTRGEPPLVWAPAYAIYDRPGTPASADSHFEHLGEQARAALEDATSELLLISPYFVPGEEERRFLLAMRGRGVRVAVLTNSLASTDVLSAHAGYARYRAELLRGGIELYEVVPQSGALHPLRVHRWSRSSGFSLHAKIMIVDRRSAFVGSMNLDPRSRLHNTELIVAVESTELGSTLAALFDEGTEAHHAFRVLLREPQQPSDALVWITEEQDREVRYEAEPHAGFWKHFWRDVLSIIVPEHLL